MTEKTFKIINGDISDGYHTFEELYEHRNALFCYMLRHGIIMYPFAVLEHYDGWDLVGGSVVSSYAQVSYHIPVKDRELWKTKGNSPFIKMFTREEYEKEKLWDGHTPADVVKRLNGAAIR